MRVILLFLTIFSLLISCKDKPAIVKQLAGSDSLVITFNLPGTDSVIGTVSTTETNAIQKLAGFMDGKEQAKQSCGYDGNMIFFKGGQQALPVVFKFSGDCKLFMYELEQKLIYTEVSKEGAAFLESLKEGKNWY